jgi:hypothetical protein
MLTKDESFVVNKYLITISSVANPAARDADPWEALLVIAQPDSNKPVVVDLGDKRFSTQRDALDYSRMIGELVANGQVNLHSRKAGKASVSAR